MTRLRQSGPATCAGCCELPVACVCRQCQDCGGNRPTNVLGLVHRCSSAWGEWADVPMYALPPPTHVYRVDRGEWTGETVVLG